MNQFDAVFQDGVFKPLVPIVLPENQRVRLELCSAAISHESEWIDAVLARKKAFVERHGLLPDSTPDIAADRAR